MQTPIGPSLQVVLSLSGDVADITIAGLTYAWDRWLGPQRFARKLDQLQRAGFVDVRSSGAEMVRVVRLTEAGRLAASGGRDPADRWNRSWDGRWRMVLFDVAESKRTERVRLVRQLRSMRFGYLQDSVWISPDPLDAVRAAVRGLAVDTAVITMMEATPSGGETDADLVRGAWDFARINRHYEDHLKILRSRPTSGTPTTRQSWMRTEWNAWIRAVRIDPMLPAALLPRGYRGREAWAARQERFSRFIRPA